jgi:hypothetical protein
VSFDNFLGFVFLPHVDTTILESSVAATRLVPARYKMSSHRVSVVESLVFLFLGSVVPELNVTLTNSVKAIGVWLHRVGDAIDDVLVTLCSVNRLVTAHLEYPNVMVI